MKIFSIFYFIILSYAYDFIGDGTYYGGAGKGGSCTSSYVPSDFTTVAINHEQYNNGLACGSCLEGIIIINSEKKYFKAIVDNICPECQFGSLDFGEKGDGRWKVEWSFMDCPYKDLIISTQGSNSYYGKIKIEAGGAIKSVLVNNKVALSSFDGYWIINDVNGTLGCGANLHITFLNNKTKAICVDGKLFGGICNQEYLCNNQPTITPTENPTHNESCQKIWKQCGGKNWTGKTCCSKELKCTFINKWYSQCKPKAYNKCQKIWQQCGGKNWTGKKCCNKGLRCSFINEWYSQCLL